MEKNEALIVENDQLATPSADTRKGQMLDAFFRIHDYLVEHAKMPIRRQLMDEIDWNDRLIAIKGGRGVGKTDFLLSRAKEVEIDEKKKAEEEALASPKRRRLKRPLRPCLYVSMNDFFFTRHSLMEVPVR